MAVSSSRRQSKNRKSAVDKYQSISQWYSVGKTLGEGTFGKVKKGIHKLTGVKVAIKVLVKKRIVDVADVERVSREILILKRIRHPNVVRLYEVIDTSKYIFLIMEFAPGGELFDYIVAHGRVDEREACKFFHQILNGVDYCHQHNVIHRDLKPENLLLDRRKGIKIVDFGLGNIVAGAKGTLKTACGSPCYAAPEMIAGKQYIGKGVDVWSLGVILFALICGYLPFEDPNTSQLYKKILKGAYKCPSFVSPTARDLIARILNTDPATRLKAANIRSHPWYTQCSVLTDPINNQAPGAAPPQKILIASANHHGGGIGSLLKDKSSDSINQKINKTGLLHGIGTNGSSSGADGANGGDKLDQDILRQLAMLGYDVNQLVESVSRHKHDHFYATYYLMEARKAQGGGNNQNQTPLASVGANLGAMTDRTHIKRPVIPGGARAHQTVDDSALQQRSRQQPPSPHKPEPKHPPQASQEQTKANGFAGFDGSAVHPPPPQQPPRPRNRPPSAIANRHHRRVTSAKKRAEGEEDRDLDVDDIAGLTAPNKPSHTPHAPTAQRPSAVPQLRLDSIAQQNTPKAPRPASRGSVSARGPTAYERSGHGSRRYAGGAKHNLHPSPHTSTTHHTHRPASGRRAVSRAAGAGHSGEHSSFTPVRQQKQQPKQAKKHPSSGAADYDLYAGILSTPPKTARTDRRDYARHSVASPSPHYIRYDVFGGRDGSMSARSSPSRSGFYAAQKSARGPQTARSHSQTASKTRTSATTGKTRRTAQARNRAWRPITPRGSSYSSKVKRRASAEDSLLGMSRIEHTNPVPPSSKPPQRPKPPTRKKSSGARTARLAHHRRYNAQTRSAFR